MTRKTINYIKDFYGVDVIRDVVRDWGGTTLAPA